MSKKLAVILSGCGFQDGAEIQEACYTLLNASKLGFEVSCFAPNLEQTQVVNHLTGETESESRNTLNESARIARGKIQDLNQLNTDDYDAIVFPGGFGVALNLCDFAKKGHECQVLPSINQIILDFYKQKKPIGAACIAPALIARVLGTHGVTVTIGENEDVSTAIKKMGAIHKNRAVDEVCVDEQHKVVTAPAYMYDATPAGVEAGISQLIQQLADWCS